MSALRKLLDSYREHSASERDKGDSFERLIQYYLTNDPKYNFEDVWLWSEWAKKESIDARDTGIDLVAVEKDNEQIWAIQCKFYDEKASINKSKIDSFFTASGKKPFTHRLIVMTSSKLSPHVESAVKDQHIPCSTLILSELEASSIAWEAYTPNGKPTYKPKKSILEHQKRALDATFKGLEHADRGKLIMACGTGKTFTALKISEQMVGKGGKVLFLVPSLSLLSQTLNEWTIDSEIPLRSFAVCSDSSTGKRKKDDSSFISVTDLAYPATTESKKLSDQLSVVEKNKMTVVFSTYQSIQVISEAQKKYGVSEFDLIVCDEAHRTTGATLAGEDESNFVRVHDQNFLQGKKRIYMTATPRVFGDAVKSKANEAEATLCSMDNPELFGETLFTINFSEAVYRGLLCDYKVLVLAVDESHVSSSLQKLLSEDNELKLDDASKIIGCWKALSTKGSKDKNSLPMKRAVAFCRDIASSKLITEYFPKVVDQFLEEDENYERDPLRCELQHVDGSFNSIAKSQCLAWLKDEDNLDNNICRILTNARCLTEGVDVPSLDAILFMHPRKSQIDIVQAVGRVMRRAPGKEKGYVVLPIGIPAGQTADQALADNERYKVVWQVLQALRSHDDRFDAMINKIDLGADVSMQMEIIAVTNQLPERKEDGPFGPGIGEGSAPADEEDNSDPSKPKQTIFRFDIEEIDKAIYARIVKKCGNRQHWEEWAGDIAEIAKTHITRIKAAVEKSDSKERKAFNVFLEEIRDDLNDSITEQEAIEMLAQHIITRPVFDALFEGYDFTANNPVSQAMQEVLAVLDEHNLKKESESLQRFYDSVKFRAKGIDSAEGKQKIVVELYDKFFRNAFPKMTEKLGIVYTPVEVVDFIIHSVNDVLKEEFGQTLGSKGVHILDPFTGTGTFITRLLQSGLIKPEELEYKYKNEIHANEIVLLAYYIAAINIEAVYHSMSGGDYEPFAGICLTDTFQLYEKDDLISKILVDNSSRRIKQKGLDIRVILGNPPYSAGQTSANDNNANIAYPTLDESIRQSYAAHTSATNKNALYDSYIRAFRWASDRIGNQGILGYVSGNSFIEKPVTSGMRKCLAEEYSNLYVVNLRGDIRKNMLSKGIAGEGENIFGSASMTGIAISILVKNLNAKKFGQIYYYDIGDNEKRDRKIAKISEFRSTVGISQAKTWQKITPDAHNDWLNQRDESFYEFLKIGDKKSKDEMSIFENYSRGVATGRDSWCYNYSRRQLEAQIQSMIDFYNKEVSEKSFKINAGTKIDDLIDVSPNKISWNRSLKNDFAKGKHHSYEEKSVYLGTYRPFTKSWSYFNRAMNDMVYQMPRIFPEAGMGNRVISVSGKGSRNGLSFLMLDSLPDLNLLEAGAQCFPLKIYEKASDLKEPDLFSSKNQKDGYAVKDGITDEALKHFKDAYPKEKIIKEDIFYYIYGLFHSEDYRERYKDNLSKELPRIPCVKKKEDFWHFSRAGKELAELHLGYETVEPLQVKVNGLNPWKDSYRDDDVRVTKMKFGKGKDRSKIIYNNNITLSDIPLEVYDYVINGKPAVEWVMERQCVSTDKNSGIVKDANSYATETMRDAAYPFKLLQRVMRVSVETMKIVRELPKLDI